MNANELKGRIVAAGYTIESFCVKAGFTRSTFDRKMSGASKFDQAEICRIVSVLGLSMEDVRTIFFADLVA